MAKKFNKGEWSELYTLIKILHDKKIYLFDKNLNLLDCYYNVIQVLRKENKEEVFYNLLNKSIKKEYNNKKILILEKKIKKYIDIILSAIQTTKGASFVIPKIENLFKLLQTDSIKEGNSFKKADIDLVIKDSDSSKHKIGFSIKSYLGSMPTLLNASKSTNFVFKIAGLKGGISSINKIKTKSKIRDRILSIIKKGGRLSFSKLDSSNFESNLKKVDTQLPKILSVFLLNFFYGNGSTLEDLLKNIKSQELKKMTKNDFAYKMKSFLLGIALGFVPSKKWDGFDTANGYIIVKKDGDLGCFNVFEKKILASYLYNNIKFDTPSSSRHDFGYVERLK